MQQNKIQTEARQNGCRVLRDLHIKNSSESFTATFDKKLKWINKESLHPDIRYISSCTIVSCNEAGTQNILLNKPKFCIKSCNNKTVEPFCIPISTLKSCTVVVLVVCWSCATFIYSYRTETDEQRLWLQRKVNILLFAMLQNFHRYVCMKVLQMWWYMISFVKSNI